VSSLFSKFEIFGAIADSDKRKKLAKAIYEQLQMKSENSIGFANAETDNFATAIDQILSNPIIIELCTKDSELAEKITEDILDFINSTKKHIIKEENPFGEENALLKNCFKIDKKEFINYYKSTIPYLQDNYNEDKLNISFYTEQFKSCFFEEEWDKQIKNPAEDKDIELSLISKFEKVNTREKEFFPLWKEALNFIAKTYKRRDIDCNEYFSKFREAFNQNKDLKNEAFTAIRDSFISNWKQIREKKIIKEENEKNQNSKKKLELRNSIQKSQNEKFNFIKEHFIENWERLIKEKQIRWELDQIEKQRKKFCDELYNRINELKKLQEVLEPFTKELGRLWDMTKGSWQHVNFDILKRYAEFLQNDNSLKELAEMLGKMRQAEKKFEEELFSNIQLKSEWKVEHASKADLIGIHESDDLSSLLPSETALLADAIMQSVFFKKFAEKKLQTFEYQAKMLSYREEEFQDKRQKEKEEAKGPFIICVDTSGSMHGTPETVAKTLCFAILKIAIRDNRKCYLISFSTGIETLNLTDLKNSLDKLISFLSMSFNGGTDATPAVREALRMMNTQDYKKADVIMVSDFIMPAFDKPTLDQIKSAKENKTKFHSLVIGNSQNPATIKDFDNLWFYNLNNSNRVLTLVKNINEI
jgi:uncharacterized protein with von Willebrand factor type A (vWA) domain